MAHNLLNKFTSEEKYTQYAEATVTSFIRGMLLRWKSLFYISVSLFLGLSWHIIGKINNRPTEFTSSTQAYKLYFLKTVPKADQI